LALRFDWEVPVRAGKSLFRHKAMMCALLLLAACDARSPNMDDFGLTPGIQGVVIDAVTGRAVREATVSVQRRIAKTDTTGRYYLTGLKAATSLVSVVHPNYVTAERSVRIVNFDTPADFRLDPR
jgi:hypothetical protein